MERKGKERKGWKERVRGWDGMASEDFTRISGSVVVFIWFAWHGRVGGVCASSFAIRLHLPPFLTSLLVVACRLYSVLFEPIMLVPTCLDSPRSLPSGIYSCCRTWSLTNAESEIILRPELVPGLVQRAKHRPCDHAHFRRSVLRDLIAIEAQSDHLPQLTESQMKVLWYSGLTLSGCVLAIAFM